MKKIIIFLCFLLVSGASFSQNNDMKREKRAQTGMKFLGVSLDARASGMADATTALQMGSVSMFYNPAGMAYTDQFSSLSMGQVNWIADMKYYYGSFIMNPAQGRLGTFGLTIMAANYGDFYGTIRDPGEQGYIDTGIFSPNAYSVGFGYAKALSTQFSVGGNVKYVKQDLGTSIVGMGDESGYLTRDYKEGVIAFDFGILYRTGFKSLNFGMCVRNFSREIKYEDEGFQLPLIFKIGFSMDLFDLLDNISSKNHQLLASIDATHPRDFPEQLNAGIEYLFAQMFALRAGYSTPNDEHNFSAGLGFRQAYENYRLALDYSYTPFGIFDDVHRFSLQFSF